VNLILFDSGSGYVGFVVDKAGLGHIFSKYFCVPCQISFHRLLHTHYHRTPLVASVIVDSFLLHPKKKKKIHMSAHRWHIITNNNNTKHEGCKKIQFYKIIRSIKICIWGPPKYKYGMLPIQIRHLINLI
jgi:hypothetical protein